jgi:hypothetical protein
MTDNLSHQEACLASLAEAIDRNRAFVISNGCSRYDFGAVDR